MKHGPTLAPFLEAYDAITAFETTRKSISWHHAGFHVWPIVKYVLIKQLIIAMNAGYAPTERYDAYPKLAKKMCIDTSVKARLRRLKRRKTLRPPPPVENNLPSDLLKDHPIWVLGSASGFYDLGTQEVCQHHHALRQALSDNGAQSLGLYSGVSQGLTLSPLAYGPNASLDAFIQHVTHTAPVLPLSAAYLRRHFVGLDDVIATTGHKPEALFAYIDTLIGRVAYTIRQLTPIFRTAPPRAVFSSNYASFYGWALAYLCRRYNRPFTDIQHGIQGRYNGSYYFARTPRRDWRIMPQAQLSWSTSDAALFCAGHRARKASVVGPTWEGLAPFLPAARPDQNLRTSARKAPLLVYIGQASEDVHIAAKLAQRGLNIVFRAHPMRRGESADLVSDALWADLKGETASDMALPHLLAQAQGIVTGYSAVILEAGLQRIPCFAIGAFASLVAQDYESALNGQLSLAKPEVGPEVGPDLLDQIVEWAARIPATQEATPPECTAMGDALRSIGVLPNKITRQDRGKT